MVLTKSKPLDGKVGYLISYKVAGSTEIYKSALVCLNEYGYAVPGSDAENLTFIGLAYEEAENDGGDGDMSVRVMKGGTFPVEMTNAEQGDVGKAVYINDDNTVALTTTNSILAGYIVEVLSTNRVMIRIDNAVK